MIPHKTDKAGASFGIGGYQGREDEDNKVVYGKR